ncbi:hypothetical protein SAMN05421664_3368 [Chryseobacterium soldanellicola]|uniref:Outer membrane lipoprotein-sorting protein n=1 Tax=Chryseobacterium soldanellicola TaxID=311333 RepID=A0A1H1FZY2_9FLAO|nr:hypothetical protein [Chryseobacterium soldanellicola]SDR06524.1 hypothetical protein SAMN05421664_3368 [Chryseobacterium soldanellicola]
MKLLYSLIILFLSTSIFAQKGKMMSTKEKAAIEQFKNEYKKKNHKRFDGKITATDTEVQFSNKFFSYDKTDKITGQLLKEGLLYPQLFTDYQMQKFLDETTDKTQKRFLKLQKDPRASFDVNNVKLSNATEITALSSIPRTKVFKINYKDNKLGNNSILYLIELTNKSATKETSLEDFIKGSTLTYIQQERLD